MCATRSVSITELKRSPSAVLEQAGAEPVAILNHNRPAAYLRREAGAIRISCTRRSRLCIMKPNLIASGIFRLIHGRVGPLEDVVLTSVIAAEQGHANAGRAMMFHGAGGLSLVLDVEQIRR